MGNDLYYRILYIVSPYIGEDKAKTVLDRQLSRCRANADTVTVGNVQEIMKFLIAATTLHLHPDKVRQAELASKLKTVV